VKAHATFYAKLGIYYFIQSFLNQIELLTVRFIALKNIYVHSVKDSQNLSKLSDQSLRHSYWLVLKL